MDFEHFERDRGENISWTEKSRGGSATTPVASRRPVDGSLVDDESFEKILAELIVCKNNDHIVETLTSLSMKYLFRSDQLILVLNITPSVVTWLRVMEIMCPRLVDPKVNADEILGKFRFSEDRARAEELLRDRSLMLEAERYSPLSPSTVDKVGGRGRGRGSFRGRAGSARVSPVRFGINKSSSVG